jgi:hypothetical protein
MRLAGAVMGAALCAVVQAAPARADGWTCAASAARVTVAGQTAEPATAGGGCASMPARER